MRVWAKILTLLVVTGCFVRASSCGGDTNEFAARDSGTGAPLDPYKCLNDAQLPHDPNKTIEKVGRVSQGLFADSATLWNRPDHTIPMCWQEDTYRAEDQPYRDLVKQSVMDQWQKRAFSWDKLNGQNPAIPVMQITGFEKCAPGDTDSVRMSVHDEVAMAKTETLGIGRQLLGPNHTVKKDAVAFNFSFQNILQADYCRVSEKQKRECIAWFAVHEFGHVLGFAHEQNRPDGGCAGVSPAGGAGNLRLGPLDAESVMNGCNPKTDNHGVLSDGDILGARAAYYSGMFEFACLDQVVAQMKGQSKNQSTPQSNMMREPAVDTQSTGVKTLEPATLKPIDGVKDSEASALPAK